MLLDALSTVLSSLLALHASLEKQVLVMAPAISALLVALLVLAVQLVQLVQHQPHLHALLVTVLIMACTVMELRLVSMTFVARPMSRALDGLMETAMKLTRGVELILVQSHAILLETVAIHPLEPVPRTCSVVVFVPIPMPMEALVEMEARALMVSAHPAPTLLNATTTTFVMERSCALEESVLPVLHLALVVRLTLVTPPLVPVVMQPTCLTKVVVNCLAWPSLPLSWVSWWPLCLPLCSCQQATTSIVVP